MSDAAWMQIAPIIGAIALLVGAVNVIVSSIAARRSGGAEKKASEATTAATAATTEAKAAKTAVETVDKKTDAQTVTIEQAAKAAGEAADHSNGTLAAMSAKYDQLMADHITLLTAERDRLLADLAKATDTARAPTVSAPVAPGATIILQTAPAAPAAAQTPAGVPGDRRAPDSSPTPGGRRATDLKLKPETPPP